MWCFLCHDYVKLREVWCLNHLQSVHLLIILTIQNYTDKTVEEIREIRRKRSKDRRKSVIESFFITNVPEGKLMHQCVDLMIWLQSVIKHCILLSGIYDKPGQIKRKSWNRKYWTHTWLPVNAIYFTS